MSQSLTGTAWGVFTAKGKTEKRRSRKPGPEWKKPLLVSKAQIAGAAFQIVMSARSAVSDVSLVSASNALFHCYLLAKGVQNYRVTRRSAQEAPLRELLGADAPANDNVLTPDQSLSNSYNLVTRSFNGNAASCLGISAEDTYQTGRLFLPGLGIVGMAAGFNLSFASYFRNTGKTFGPSRMPSLTGKLPPSRPD